MQEPVVDVERVINQMTPQMRIFVAGGPSEPIDLLHQLKSHSLPADLHFVQFPIPGYNQTDFTSWHPSYRFDTFFMTSALREADPNRLNYLPMQMRAIYDYLSKWPQMALIQAARNKKGRLCAAPNVDFLSATVGKADLVVAELNEAIVAPAGAPVLPDSVVFVPSRRPLFEPAPVTMDSTSQAIGRLVAEVIKDGDCLQTGIGAIPAAILAALDDKSDLGMHGGLIDDGGLRLIKNGNISGKNKPIDVGMHIVGMALGSSALLNELANDSTVQFRSADYTHEACIIRQIPNFVSINSAVEVDLHGQVNAEFAGGRQISGTGGSVDFMRSAKASAGGRSVVALPATAKGGSRSRIVPRVEMVTALRTDVDLVVTEYGVASLKNLSSRGRAEALIKIAAPQFRDSLRESI